MEADKKKERFLSYAQQIKDLGFRVFYSSRSLDNFFFYGFIVNNNDEIGTFSLCEDGNSLCFSTKHKYCIDFGDGFLLDNSFEGQTEITKSIVERCFKHHAEWVKSNKWSNPYMIRKWNASEFFKQYWDKDNIKEL